MTVRVECQQIALSIQRPRPQIW